MDAADPVKRDRALDAIAPRRSRELVISAQVLTEFYAVVTRKLAVRVSPDDAAAMVRELAVLPVVAIDASLVASAIVGVREWQVSIWDALNLRAAAIAGCRRVLSEDLSDGQAYGPVMVENPFARHLTHDLRVAPVDACCDSQRCPSSAGGPSHVTCPNCCTESRPGAKFCAECATPLGAGTPHQVPASAGAPATATAGARCRSGPGRSGAASRERHMTL